MKKLLLAVLAVLLNLPFILAAQTDNWSKPAGSMRIQVDADSEKLVSLPLSPFNPSLNALFQGQLTGGTSEPLADRISVWDAASQSFSYSYLAGGTGDPLKDGKWYFDLTIFTPSSVEIQPGCGFFILNNQSASQTVFASGSLILEDSMPLLISPSLNLISYPCTSKISLNNTQLHINGAFGAASQSGNPDLVSVHDPAADHWLLSSPGNPNDGKWLDANNNVSSVEFCLGTALWYDRKGAGSFTWTESRPYNNDFDVSPNAPALTNIAVNADLGEAILSISCTGSSGEILEIFYKDLSEGDALQTESGWQVAENNIGTAPQTSISWVDAGNLNRPAPTNCFLRLYIVSRQDIDSDSDGFSDGYETFVSDTNPNNPDSDSDGLNDADEINTHLTNPLLADTDGDSYSDFNEINNHGTDPNDPSSYYGSLPSPWQHADVGSVGIAGTAQYLAPVFTIQGSGNDIQSTSDQFHYMYQDSYGDCEIVVRVFSQQNTNSWAKTGIMIRESLNANSANAFVGITPSNAATFQRRYSTANYTSHTGGGTGFTAPCYLKLVRSGNNFSAYISSDTASWTQVGSTNTIAMPTSVKIGLAVCSHTNSSLSSVKFDNISISRTLSAPLISPAGGEMELAQSVTLSSPVPGAEIYYTADGSVPTQSSTPYTAPFTLTSSATVKAIQYHPMYAESPIASANFTIYGALPPGYVGQDIGSPSIAGISGYDGATFTVKASGSDIAGTSDQCRYLYESIDGDCEIVARVVSIDNTNTWAKAGIMIRETTNSNSTHAFATLTAANGTAFQRRRSTGS
jgi:hypothetical protein